LQACKHSDTIKDMLKTICPTCIEATGNARTAPELRYGECKPFDFSDTTVEIVPCQICRDRTGILTVRLRKSRALELTWHELDQVGALLTHRDGLVAFTG
jgi:hypothetical protein